MSDIMFMNAINIVIFAVCCGLCVYIGISNSKNETIFKFWENVASLVKVKTIVTFIIMGVFSYLACTEKISGEQVVTVTTMIVGFYFGTQKEKKE